MPTGSDWERIESPTRERETEMDVEGGSCTVCSEIQRLPEECVSAAISLTSPRDACRSEAVSASFRSAAASDDVWKSFLPSDYAEILARAVDRVEFASMKQLYFRLCDPILIDGGKMGFFVDRETGVKCFILSARELGIAWGDTPQYWNWIHHPESRFPVVAELRFVCWLEIHGRINCRILSKRSYYSAYLIFKLSNSAMGLTNPLQEASVTIGTHVSKSPVRLMEHEDSSRSQPIMRRPRFLRNLPRRENLPNLPDKLPEDLPEHLNEQAVLLQEDLPEQDEPQHDRRPNQHEQGDREMVGKPQIRRDGWMEMLLGEFYNEEGDDGEVVMSLLEIKGLNGKHGLNVEGIEIRPTNKVFMWIETPGSSASSCPRGSLGLCGGILRNIGVGFITLNQGFRKLQS